jgi:hypothetical protein
LGLLAAFNLAGKDAVASRSPLKKHEEWLLELVRREPDLTLEEIQCRLRDERLQKAGAWVGLAVFRPPRHQLQKKQSRRRAGST